MTACSYVADELVPYSCDESCGLLTIGLAHLVGNEHLWSTLISAYLCGLHLYTELCQEVLNVVHLCTESVPVNGSLRVKKDLVGNTTNMICTL